MTVMIPTCNYSYYKNDRMATKRKRTQHAKTKGTGVINIWKGLIDRDKAPEIVKQGDRRSTREYDPTSCHVIM